MKARVLMVDDEYPARMELRHYLSQFDNLAIIGEASNADEAYQLITALDYDVVFLDIRMPGMNGLQLVQAIQSLDNPPKVVFVTAYEEYALEAFKVQAFDYILKPLEDNRVREVVKRIDKEICKFDTSVKKNDFLQLLPGELNGIIYPVKIQDIVYIYSENELIYVKVKQGVKMLIRFTIRELERKLDATIFFRSHRCFIVNVNYVKEIRPGFHGTFSMIMQDEEPNEVPVSRSQAKILKSIFNFDR